MSIEDVEESVRSLKIITEAEAIWKENQSLREQIDVMEREHRNALDEKDDDIHVLKMVNDQKDRDIRERDSAKIRFKRKSYSPRAFQALLDEKFDEKVEAEIERKVVERWDREKLQLVHEALQEEVAKYPASCMPQTWVLLDSASRALRDALLKNRDQWPSWFRDLYKAEVQTGITGGLDAEFTRRVEEKAQSRIVELTNIEWPRYVSGTANRFFQRSLVEQLNNLRRPIHLSCDKCGAEYEEQLTTQDIASLLKKPVIKFTCSTPGCRDFLRPHGIPLSLADVILQLERPRLRYKVAEEGPVNSFSGVSIF